MKFARGSQNIPSQSTNIADRMTLLGPNLAPIPERLLLAHARGEVLFITGSGISKPSGLPDFPELVLQVYQQLDPAAYSVMKSIPPDTHNQYKFDSSNLIDRQIAEIERFISRDYDVVLGMLERRMDGIAHNESVVREVVKSLLKVDSSNKKAKPSPIHHALIKLADRGKASTIVTTNFDSLLEDAADKIGLSIQKYALGAIPRPMRTESFSGVLHIHGIIECDKDTPAPLILTDHDFGEYYLRQRIIPDFIYDTARIFNIVFVGYSANDPPMRYLLNAIAADDTRFKDFKERFTFVDTINPVVLEDWRGRGITPIPYTKTNGHSMLVRTLKRWAVLSMKNGDPAFVDSEMKRLVQKKYDIASDADHDIFEHLIRRSIPKERERLSELISKQGADLGWLNALVSSAFENLTIENKDDCIKSIRDINQLIQVFVRERMESVHTIEWALKLGSNDNIKRSALRCVFKSIYDQTNEPWRTAWSLILESWNKYSAKEETFFNIYQINQQLNTGNRNWSLIESIIDLVRPYLKFNPLSTVNETPGVVDDIFIALFTSEENHDLNELTFECLCDNDTDKSFLKSLGLALDSLVFSALNTARKIGWDGHHDLWQLGSLYRVYFARDDENDRHSDPDELNQGIAPSVKLLHSVVARLIDIDIQSAKEFIQRWKITNSPIHLRLWASLSRNHQLTHENEVGDFLVSLDDQKFWELGGYPEIAELRAIRFKELTPSIKRNILDRIRKLPPYEIFTRIDNADKALIDNARQYWAVREFQRIELADSSHKWIEAPDKEWMNSLLNNNPDWPPVTRIDTGFHHSPEASWTEPNPDNQYDLLPGNDLLNALEKVLLPDLSGWPDSPAGRAMDWMKQSGRSIIVLSALESVPDYGVSYPRVWGMLCLSHLPFNNQNNTEKRDLHSESTHVLSLFEKFPKKTLTQLIDRISYWFHMWERHIDLSMGATLWFKLWPIAVETTRPINGQIIQTSIDFEMKDIDTLNTPIGRLISFFLVTCPTYNDGEKPFSQDNIHRKMRDTIEESIGSNSTVGLTVKSRLIERLYYFLKADSEWTIKYLVAPLLKDDSTTPFLWRAVARKTRFHDELKLIGNEMLKRTTDPRLEKQARHSLVANLIIECLYAKNENREPAIPFAHVQQMLRIIDPEARAYGADLVQRFVHDFSSGDEKSQARYTPEYLFRFVAKPFLQEVWPQERSLTTSKISEALADLPAISIGAFADAVNVIERFLVPFTSWSIHDYGFFVKKDKMSAFSVIETKQDAKAFLVLLDLTIGEEEETIIPYDLGDALDCIRRIDQSLEKEQAFRRLETAVRRGQR